MSLLKNSLLLCLCALCCFCPEMQADNSGPPQAQAGGKDNVESRIKRQRMRIKRCEDQGTIKKDVAAQLKSGLDNLEARVNTQKQQNGGALKPEQLKVAENSLNQNNDQIKSFEGAGTSVVDKSKVLGPTWTPGKDGAQNAGSLKKQMKQEERRELRQEKQANEQTLEQQQLNYEKSTMTKLQGQRNGILKKKSDLKQERQQTGAN